MKRSAWIWCAFALCVLLVAGAMAWATLQAVRLDVARARESALDDAARRALWRMEGIAGPLVAEESARPYFMYFPFHGAGRAYTNMFGTLEPGEVLVPSPLLTIRSPYMRVHFQLEPDGTLTSPQVPLGPMREAALAGYVSGGEVAESERRLGEVRELIGGIDLLSCVVVNDESQRRAENNRRLLNELASADNPADGAALESGSAPGVRSAQVPAPDLTLEPEAAWNASKQAQAIEDRQARDKLLGSMKSQAEQSYDNRGNVYQTAPPPPEPAPASQHAASPPAEADAADAGDGGRSQSGTGSGDALPPADIAAQTMQQAQTGPQSAAYDDVMSMLNVVDSTVTVGRLTPVWLGDSLVLARIVSNAQGQRVQGCMLDWPALRSAMLAEAQPLLPGASLEPISMPAIDDQPLGERALASLPVALVTGELPKGAVGLDRALLGSLAVAWAGLLVAAGAVGLLLGKALGLSERRALFVSTLTHELRTPLTTLRLYADLLADPAREDPGARGRYVATMRAESARLAQLIENVLAYSRIERGRRLPEAREIPLGDLVDRALPRLQERAARSPLTLEVRIPDELRSALLRTDASAVEQILINLVDNACKYAAGADDKRIILDAVADGGGAALRGGQGLGAGSESARAPSGAVDVMLRVTDFGPGVGPQATARLFRAFEPGQGQSSAGASGIGLGLALCRRLARESGAELSLDRAHRDGARFALRLPRA